MRPAIFAERNFLCLLDSLFSVRANIILVSFLIFVCVCVCNRNVIKRCTHLWKFYFRAHFYGATNMIIFAYYTTRITREIIFFQRLLPGLSLSIATHNGIYHIQTTPGGGREGGERRLIQNP